MADKVDESSLGHVPDGRWAFDESVTRVFDDMLERSIPHYWIMRDAVTALAEKYLRDGGRVLDIGCSRGGAIASLLDRCPHANFLGLEISPPMLDAARHRFQSSPRVRISNWDLRGGIPPYAERSNVILSVLTLMFVPIEHRLRLVQALADNLFPGGVLILVEKVLGSSAMINDRLVAEYHAMKAERGYTQEEIERKRLSLEGVLVPMTAQWNVEMLKASGFGEVDCFWRWMNFGAWIAIKS